MATRCAAHSGRWPACSCAGFCGHGVMQSAAVGVLMADRVLARRLRVDLSAAEADRFFSMPNSRTVPL